MVIPPATHRCGYIPWRVLMRQLGIDVETCPRCGGKMKIIALVRDLSLAKLSSCPSGQAFPD
ncbi:MAG TPA: hypothetical protein VF524_07010, partial [Polyangia bacterium]